MRLFALVLASCLLLFAAPTQASTARALSLEALAVSADLVVRGTVLEQRAQWSADGRRIFTTARLQVHERLKGDPEAPDVVEIRLPGGTVGTVTQRVLGLASFSEGEEAIVFLRRRSEGWFQVRGLAQGKFRVLRDAPEAPRVVRDASDLRLLHEGRSSAPMEKLGPVPLDAFLKDVSSALGGRRPGGAP